MVAGIGVVLSGCPPEDEEVEEGTDNQPTSVDEIDEPDFAYQALHNGEQRIHVATLDGEYAELTDAEGFADDDMAAMFSWDGTRLAYTHGSNSASDLFVHDLADGEQTRLTEFGEDNNHMCIPRNFDSSSEDIAIHCLTGDDDQPYYAAVVSPDGEAEVFDPDTGLLDVDDDQLQIIDGGFYEDDDFIGLAWHYDSVTDESTQQLRHLDPNDPEDPGDVLVELEEVGHPFPQSLSVRDSGDRTVAAFTLLTDPDDVDSTRIYVADLDEGEVTEVLADEDDVKYSLSLDADNERLLFATGTSQTGIGRLATLDLDSGDETVLADSDDLQRGTLRGRFSPDGQQVIFSDVEATLEEMIWEEASIYLVDTDGSNIEQVDWAHDPDKMTSPSFNPAAF